MAADASSVCGGRSATGWSGRRPAAEIEDLGQRRSAEIKDLDLRRSASLAVPSKRLARVETHPENILERLTHFVPRKTAGGLNR